MRNDNDAAKSSRSQKPTEAFHGMCTACTRTFLFSATPAQRRQRRQRPCASTPRGADARKREEARLQQASGDEPRHSGSRRQRDVEAPGAGSEAELVARPRLLQRKTAHSSVLSCSLGSETRDALLAKNRRRHDATTPRRLRLRQKVRTPRATRHATARGAAPHGPPTSLASCTAKASGPAQGGRGQNGPNPVDSQREEKGPRTNKNTLQGPNCQSNHGSMQQW